MQLDNLVFVIISILISLGFHEAMHAFTSHWLGDTTAHDAGRLTLNPMAHIDLLTTVLLPVVMIMLRLPPFLAAKPVPFNPARVKYEEFGVALVGIAGPLTNLLLGIAGAGAFRIIQPSGGFAVFMLTFISINIGLFVFNMIPFPPLDGSRLLYAFAPEPLQKLMYSIESMGFSAILVFMLLLFPVIGPLVQQISEKILLFLLV